MLVLSRRKGERIRIGTDIEIVVTDVVGDRVRLGIVAPLHVPVHREEVYRRVCQEQQPVLPTESNSLDVQHLSCVAIH